MKLPKYRIGDFVSTADYPDAYQGFDGIIEAYATMKIVRHEVEQDANKGEELVIYKVRGVDRGVEIKSGASYYKQIKEDDLSKEAVNYNRLATMSVECCWDIWGI